MSPENPRPTNEIPCDIARAIGFRRLENAPIGVVFVTNPSSLVAEA